MNAEGNETPGSDPGMGRSEGDIFAERRALRAAETGERALFHRAETAEATVRTLEAHVATLQERLREGGAERERLSALARESRAEVEQLKRRVEAGESDVRAVSARLDGVRRELVEAEEAAVAERSDMRRAERELQLRLTELERRAFEINRGLEAERAARARAEQMLDSMRRGRRAVERQLVELRVLVTRLKHIAAARPTPEPAASVFGVAPRPSDTSAEAVPRPDLDEIGAPAGGVQSQADRAEMAEALSAAVGRLRARAEDDPATAAEVPEPDTEEPAEAEPSTEHRRRHDEDEPAARELREQPSPIEHSSDVEWPSEIERAAAVIPDPPKYKHSMSLIKRWRLALRRRRARRKKG
jgi:hypothetical protein